MVLDHFRKNSSSVSENFDGKEFGPFQDGENGVRSKNFPSHANDNTVEAEWIEQYEPNLKCNFDVAWDAQRGVGGVGVVIRNDQGDLLAAMAKKCEGLRLDLT
ncbi:hypothetical protein DVH24_016264 [Malus domestica]|uniref:RNase H type-1 domain-containing protein n=1 Tax=Malus domestica TaxID=3750 RepID=A0A498HTZ9_MALDO|nr:hypothetical protein DVH24_016264 [Malus domestica]